MTRTTLAAAAAIAMIAGAAHGQNLLTNPGFDDLLSDGTFGDGWSAFGAADFGDFFPASGPGHAILFGDAVGNVGGVFEAGIPATAGVEYRFRAQIAWELFWEADTIIALEFYAADDTTLISAREFNLNESVDAGYGRREITAVAPAGAVFVRPVVRFENVIFDGSLQAATIDDAELVELSPADNRLINPAFLDTDGDLTTGDDWGVFGAAATDLDFFGSGNPGHATLFGDNLGNEGFLFQTGISGEEGVTYEVAIDAQAEINWDADLYFGLEFYAVDDTTKVGETVELAAAAPGMGYRRYTLAATAPVGTAFVRPVVFFNNVQSQGVSRAVTVDNIVVTIDDGVLNYNPGLLDQYGVGNGSAWDTFGAVALDLDFFNSGDPGHATFFADQVGNTGGLFQQYVAAEEDETYSVVGDFSVESMFDATLSFGLEFYGNDNSTLLSALLTPVTAVPGAGYATQGIEAVAPAGTAFIRPVVVLDGVLSGGEMRTATADNIRVLLGGLPSNPCVPDITTDGANPGEPGFLVPDGLVSVGDLTAFVEQWVSGNAAVADITTDGANPGDPGFLVPDGSVSVGDLTAFVEQWVNGCP